MKRDHPDVAELAAALEALGFHKKKNRLTFQNLEDDLLAFGKGASNNSKLNIHPFFKKAEWRISHMSIYRIMKNGYTKNESFSRSLYLWMLSMYSDNIPIMIARKRVEQGEKLVREFRSLMRHGDDVDVERVVKYGGEYELYRPFHIDPSSLMVASLRVGVDGNPFDTVMEMRYPDEFGDAKVEVAEGKLVPMGPAATILLSMDNDSKGKFCIELYEVDHVQVADAVDGGSRRSLVRSFGGVMLASASNYAPSAWPIFGLRLMNDARPEPRVISREDREDLPSPIKQWMDKGFVGWRSPELKPR